MSKKEENEKPKRGEVDNFDGIGKPKTEKRLQLWKKNEPTGRWKQVRQIKMRYTFLIRTWKCNEKTLDQRYICPYGVKEYGKELLQDERVGLKLILKHFKLSGKRSSPLRKM